MFNHQIPKDLLSACPVYKESPFKTLQYNSLNLLVKDETQRMGLGSFKALGGVYAVARLIATRISTPTKADIFFTPSFFKAANSMTFVCASAGNHGMAVATGAKIFGAKARIYLSKAVPTPFEIRLKAIGAEVIRFGETYEESVEGAIKDAVETKAIHLADSSWAGYTKIPTLVMEGYTVIAEEIRQQCELNQCWPTHVYLQAGVGGLAAAMAFMIRKNWKIQPQIIIVEPYAAPCLAQSVANGEMVTVNGPISTMGRLDCKTPSLLAFTILSKMADRLVTISDKQAEDAAKVANILGSPTTPSGAAGLAAVLNDNNVEAQSLIIITEGVL